MTTAVPASVPDLIAARADGRHRDAVLFWGHQPHPDGALGPSCLSQWWSAETTVDGRLFATAEHRMMWEKARLFDDDAAAEQILAVPDPAAAKRLGRTVVGFDGRVWAEHRFSIVVAANRAKFGQHSDLATYLRSTDDAVLVEAAPNDAVWGIGMGADDPRATDPTTWPGLNLLGFALMAVRAQL